jgi:hypothetical protein
MKNNLGLGVMLNMLMGNEETVSAITQSLNKKIIEVKQDWDYLFFKFEDNTTLKIWDDGQSCCEHRYMVCDDDLTAFAGAIFKNIEVLDVEGVPPKDDYDEPHEIQILRVVTDKGDFRCSNHNEHNGYYGGFSIAAQLGD